ncbi:hypothetical protein E4T56_gene1930 [Termitomyces sp. T112]|nr:hypothetical protein E4T56_gene1930 [Termitomyces sp. T112]
MDDDMPQLVDRPGGGGGFIPPPPNAHFEQQEGYNPFPGAAQANPGWVPPATAPSWINYGPQSPSPWTAGAGAGWPNASPVPWSPYPHPTPASSWGEYTPATGGPAMPGLGQPIGPTRYFNVGAENGDQHAEWPQNAGPERSRRPSFGGHSPNYEEVPLNRTHSQNPPYQFTPRSNGYGGGSPLQRSLSTGATVRRRRSQSRVRNPFAREYLEQYNSENLARRPRDWRPDYPKTLIPRVPRPWSDIEEFKDSIKRTINPILDYNTQGPHVIYNLWSYPHPQTLSFPILRRIYNYIDFAQLATNPPVDQMRLFHPLLPWYIDVFKSVDNGVTVQDVIMHVYFQLQTQINARHYFNEELRSGTRERITEAYTQRTQGQDQEKMKGIKKVDYLEEKNIFVGLVRTRNGLWEMKTRSV